VTTYFAYGSNMHLRRLRTRVRSFVPLGPARLEGYRLAFHKLGRDGSGKCNVVPTGRVQDVVHGLLFELPEAELAALHRAEGFGYDQAWANVSCDGEARRAMFYLGRAEFVDDSLRPYTWYKAFVLTGAREAGLPDEYLALIDGVTAVADLDSQRDRDHRRLLGSAS
jgi:gamma-glutamylcyclotransferase